MKIWLSISKCLKFLNCATNPYELKTRTPFILSAIAALLGTLTYWALTRNIASGESNYFVLSLVYLDISILIFLAIVIFRRLSELWHDHQKGLQGSKLHVQLVGLFSLISIIPAIIVALFSAHFLNAGVEAWFAKPVRDALQQANFVAKSYLDEHKKVIHLDSFDLAEQIRPQIGHYLNNPDELTDRLNKEAESRKLSEIMILSDSKHFHVVARSYFTFMPFLEDLSADFKKAQKDNLVIVESKDRVRALIKLDSLTDTYLFIGKVIDPVVLQHVDKASLALKDYRLSAERHHEIQVTFVLFFTIVALLLLMAAIWVGLAIADMIVKPITQLIEAAHAVSEGDLSVKIGSTSINNEIVDLCNSFNRMTHQLAQQKYDLILSQKKSAWADMARKIAHEIKNPLTPIQLSAERLKRKYSAEIQSDPKTFQTCIDTIIRQVSSIGNLVTEFSNFARMPEPQMQRSDWVLLVQQSLVLQQQAHPHILFLLDSQFPVFMGSFDPHQLSQVFNNLLQNSINALTESLPENRTPIIKIKLYIQQNNLYIIIEDSGPGFPSESREKLLEPYHTTREKGTGLGLAIVSKIVSDHNGRMELLNSTDLLGACVMLSFVIKEVDTEIVGVNK